MNTEQASESIFTYTKVTFTEKIFQSTHFSLYFIRILFICNGTIKSSCYVIFSCKNMDADIFVPKFGLLQTYKHLIFKIYGDCIIVNTVPSCNMSKHYDFVEYISNYFSFFQFLFLLYYNQLQLAHYQYQVFYFQYLLPFY